MPKQIAAVVLCAGKGTRMKSARAKVLHEVLGRPLAYYPLHEALAVGAKPVVAVIGHQADQVRAALDEVLPKQLRYAVQPRQLGTAHAVLSARRELRGFSGDVLIIYGDAPLVRAETLSALVRARASLRSPVALVTTRPPRPTGYGRILRDGAGRVERIVEEKDCIGAERAIAEVNAGVYLVDARFLWKALSRVGKKNAQREFYLTDLAERAFDAGAPAAVVEAPFDEVAGVNDRVELAHSTRALRLRINAGHMRAGVTFDDPETTIVEPGVELEPDTRLGPCCILTGSTRVAKGASLGPGCVAHDSVIGRGAQVKAYSHLDGARIGAGALIGPFARLRPGTDLADGVHVGNFVETKKARIGKGSKANHLTYLGDCVIGAGVNVGAGTITCNYDGVDKHQTVLGDGVFVGSDTQLVAPVSVGHHAYVAAGSTVVEDVPPFALAIARGRQVNKPGWARTNAPRKKKKSPE